MPPTPTRRWRFTLRTLFVDAQPNCTICFLEALSMRTRNHVAVILFLTATVTVSVRASAQPPNDATNGPPELGVAVAVDAQTLELRRFIERTVTRTATPGTQPALSFDAVTKGSIAPAVEVAVITETQISRLRIADVMLRRVDGQTIPHASLAKELARSTPVAITYSDHQANPQFWKMFKPESLILQLPAPSRLPITTSNDPKRSKP